MKPKIFPRIPILLSVFVCPGAGQFMQRRWVAGVVFAAGFLVGFFWVMVLAVGNIVDYYRLAFDFDAPEPDPSSPKTFIAPFMVALVFYVINLIDVFAAQLRIQKQTHTVFYTEET